MVRYADDFIVTARDKESLEKARIQIQQWMLERGLELSSEKTLMTSMEDGFDCLGFNLRHYRQQAAHQANEEEGSRLLSQDWR